MRMEDVKREGVSSEDDPRREKIFQERKAEYLGMVKCIDDNVGRILKTLLELQMVDNTLIIFASDHGQYMGNTESISKMHFMNLRTMSEC
jgi:arylsulfatase A-like enzyme